MHDEQLPLDTDYYEYINQQKYRYTDREFFRGMDNFERENAVTLFFVSLSALVLFPLPIATRHFSKIHGNPNYSMSYSRDPLTLMILDITLTEGSRLHSFVPRRRCGVPREGVCSLRLACSRAIHTTLLTTS